jgi:cytidine deaminase
VKQANYTFSYECYEAIAELDGGDRELLLAARDAISHAYAPYSHFQVGAAIRLADLTIVTGSNQENASFPAGLCAERVALAAAASQYPGIPVQAMAITYNNEHGKSVRPISPCGICRQSLVEYEEKLKCPIRLILSGLEGGIYIIASASLLLPLGFSAHDLEA